jgi:hypothetical protein
MHPLCLTFTSARVEAHFMAVFSERNRKLALCLCGALLSVVAIHLSVTLSTSLSHGGLGASASASPSPSPSASAASGPAPAPSATASAAAALGALGAGDEPNTLTTLSSGLTLAVFAAYLGTLLRPSWPRQHFERFNIVLFASAGYGFLFAVPDARALVVLVFPVFMLLVIPARWCYLWLVTLLHQPCFALLEWREQRAIQPLLPFFWLCTFTTTLLVSRRVEQRERRDFMLQQRVQATKRHNDAILDNMLPKHVNAQRRADAKVIANNEASVSVIFCDLQDFKAIVKVRCSRLPSYWRSAPTHPILTLTLTQTLSDPF